MKVEYLPDGSPDCPLVRLYGFTTDDAISLHRVCCLLAEGATAQIVLTDQDWVEAVGDVSVVLRAENREGGMSESGPGEFSWVLNASSWGRVAGLVEPFAQQHRGGFQWLDDATRAGDGLPVLMSFTGQW